MSDKNLYELFRSRFPDDTAAPSMIIPEHRTVSFSEVDETTDRYATVLQDIGVMPGDRVMVQVEKSPEAVMLYLACLRAGAVFVPLNTAYKAGEISYFFEDAEPKLAVSDKNLALAGKNGNALHGVIFLTLNENGSGTLADKAKLCTPNNVCVTTYEDSLAAILYTSGTTGQSKGAILSVGNLMSNALALHKAWGFKDGDVLLHALPIFHVHGLFVAVHCALLNGSPMIFLPRFDAEIALSLLDQSSVFMGVPTYFTRLLKEDGLTRESCINIRLFVSGSAPLLDETSDEFFSRTGHRILERYGMTETGMNTSNPLDGDRIVGSVGLPLPKIEVRVVDETGSALNSNEVGELEVRGPNVFKGYWHKQDKTEESFNRDGFFRTGDLAKINEHGYVFIVGRSKDMIISGGLNVYPKEIEAFIDGLNGIIESAVVGLPHPDLGEGVVSVIVVENNTRIVAEDIIAQLKGSLSSFKVPKKVVFVKELPRNTMGKVMKNEIRAEYQDLFFQS